MVFNNTKNSPVQSRQELIARLRSEIPRLTKEFGVKRLGIFGSFQSGKFNQKSDVDLLVEFNEIPGLRFVRLVEELQGVLGRDADVLTLAGIKNIRNKGVAERILRTLEYV